MPTDFLGTGKARTKEGARDLVRAHTESDPWKRLQELRDVGEKKAEAEGVYLQLKHERKHLLARLASEYAAAHAKSNLSEAKLERLARADDRYREFLEGLGAAKQELESLKSKYWAIDSELEWDAKTISHLNALSRLEEPA